jgi:hypothetical protein
VSCEIFIAVLLKIRVFWDVMLCRDSKSVVLDCLTLNIICCDRPTLGETVAQLHSASSRGAAVSIHGVCFSTAFSFFRADFHWPGSDSIIRSFTVIIDVALQNNKNYYKK